MNIQVHIVDHASADPQVRRYLECCAAEGLDVRPFEGSFVDKAAGWTKATLDIVTNASFVFPLDLDEFLGMPGV